MAKARQSKPESETSGHRLMSGRPIVGSGRTSGHRIVASGSPVGSGSCDADVLFIGSEVEQETALAFQLAPRRFVVSRQGRGALKRKSVKAAKSPNFRGPLDHLPLHLTFCDPALSASFAQQRWVSDDDGPWRWELIVRHDGVAIEAILTASRILEGARAVSHIWKARTGWDSFGSNQLDPDHSGDDAVPVVVSAP